MTTSEIEEIFKEAGVDDSEYKRLLEFLLYCGVLGVRIKDDEYFIFDVNYDLKVLEIRASRAKGDAFYVVNPAFGPALGILEEP
ncbi:hypothetical protein [Bradyrhizobium sp. Gha]|uniref:hypothetical protein n=1 Tax=Bradyrhizobium sp. Gha TaxID=1855318 RepID=UPI0011606051|nr:hypothetical protein [Bradyrhizobium sp. Gha]